jgi:hypothetical protein
VDYSLKQLMAITMQASSTTHIKVSSIRLHLLFPDIWAFLRLDTNNPRQFRLRRLRKTLHMAQLASLQEGKSETKDPGLERDKRDKF